MKTDVPLGPFDHLQAASCSSSISHGAMGQLPAAAAHLQQQRLHSNGIAVDVPNGNVDRALRALSRKLKEENYMQAAAAQQFFVKPSERRKLQATQARKKLQKQEFRWGHAAGTRRCLAGAGSAGWRRPGCSLLAAGWPAQARPLLRC